MCCTLKPVDTAAALASGSTTRPRLSQPSARALPLIVVSGRSPFEASSQPFKGRLQAEHLRPDPFTGKEECNEDDTHVCYWEAPDLRVCTKDEPVDDHCPLGYTRSYAGVNCAGGAGSAWAAEHGDAGSDSP